MFTLGNGSIGVCNTPLDKLQPVRRIVVASANVQNVFWLFLITTTRSGQVSCEPRRGFRNVFFLN